MLIWQISASYSIYFFNKTKPGTSLYRAIDHAEEGTWTLMMLPSHGPEPCASANSATSAYCGRWDLNPHEHTPTRSLVLPVCQFQHSRLLFFNFLYPMIFSPTKSSIAQFHLNCKPVFRKFIPEFIESEYSKNPAHLCTGLSVMQKKGLEPSWCCHHTDLNRARLPIPPLLLTAGDGTWTHTSIHPQDP